MPGALFTAAQRAFPILYRETKAGISRALTWNTMSSSAPFLSGAKNESNELAATACREAEPDNWESFLSRNAAVLSRFKETKQRIPAAARRAQDEIATPSFILGSFLSSLDAKPQISLGHDLVALKRTITFIVEVTEQNVLTGEEAKALADFVIAKFLERRVAASLTRSFSTLSSNHWAMKGWKAKRSA